MLSNGLNTIICLCFLYLHFFCLFLLYSLQGIELSATLHPKLKTNKMKSANQTSVSRPEKRKHLLALQTKSASEMLTGFPAVVLKTNDKW